MLHIYLVFCSPCCFLCCFYPVFCRFPSPIFFEASCPGFFIFCVSMCHDCCVFRNSISVCCGFFPSPPHSDYFDFGLRCFPHLCSPGFLRFCVLIHSFWVFWFSLRPDSGECSAVWCLPPALRVASSPLLCVLLRGFAHFSHFGLSSFWHILRIAMCWFHAHISVPHLCFPALFLAVWVFIVRTCILFGFVQFLLFGFVLFVVLVFPIPWCILCVVSQFRALYSSDLFL